MLLKMFRHAEAELVCLLIAALNLATACVLYRTEVRNGITVDSATRKNAIMTCIGMCVMFGGVAIFLMATDVHHLANNTKI